MKKEEAIEAVKNPLENLYDDIMCHAIVYVQQRKEGDVFSSEDIREYYNSKTNKEPLEPRVYGPVMQKLVKDKLIRHHSYGRYKGAQGHGKICNLYERRFT